MTTRYGEGAAAGSVSGEKTSGRSPIETVIRVFGVLVMFFGLFVALQVVAKAWGLIDDPKLVADFADKIEQQAQLNRFVTAQAKRRGIAGGGSPQVSFMMSDGQQSVSKTLPRDEAVDNGSNAGGVSAGGVQKPQTEVDVSYFVAWLLLISVLSMIGKVACAIITAGGKVALYASDQTKQLKTILRELVRETKAGG